MVVLKQRATALSIRVGHFNRPMLASPLASNLLVLKISGKLCEPSNLVALAKQIQQLTAQGHKIILVHGGGKQIDAALEKADISTTKEGGRRITPAEAMPIISDTLAAINAQIAGALAKNGISTVAVNGKDYCLIDGKAKKDHGRTGSVDRVNVRLIEMLLRRSDVLVLSSLGRDTKGALNVNADDIAVAVSAAIHAKHLILLSDVPGVLADPMNPSSVIPTITVTDAVALAAHGVVQNGMVVKVATCSAAAAAGVTVLLADGDRIKSLVGLLGGTEIHTRFV